MTNPFKGKLREFTRNVVDVAKGEAKESVKEDVYKTADILGDVAKVAILAVVVGTAVKSANRAAVARQTADILQPVMQNVQPAVPVVQIFMNPGEGVTIK